MKLSIPMLPRARPAIVLLTLHVQFFSAAPALEQRNENPILANKTFLTWTSRQKDMADDNSENALKRKLRGVDLHRAIAGKKITPDMSTGQRVVDFTEFFFEDGKWMSARRERSLVQRSGTWTVSGSKICVREDGARRSVCREFRFSFEPLRAFSYDLDSGPLRSGVISFIVESVN